MSHHQSQGRERACLLPAQVFFSNGVSDPADGSTNVSSVSLIGAPSLGPTHGASMAGPGVSLEVGLWGDLISALCMSVM